MKSIFVLALSFLCIPYSQASDQKVRHRKFKSAESCKVGERPSYIDKKEGGVGSVCERIADACISEAKQAAIKVMADSADGTGIDSTRKTLSVPLTNGAVLVFPAFIQKQFGYEVIVAVDESCDVKTTFINGE